MRKANLKSILSALLTVILAAALVIVLAACEDKQDANPGETTYVSKYKSGSNFTEVKDPVSWEGINSIPIKTANMDITEARQLCVDFLRYAKTACWTPSDYYGIWSDSKLHNDGSTPARYLEAGTIYGGLPYIGWATGNVYRLMDYIDEETGVVNMEKAGAEPLAFGNQCANGAYVGFARVINSPYYTITEDMVLKNGFLRVGDYYYQDILVGYSDAYGTDEIIAENGDEVMYESYAQLKAGDGIVYYTTAGHVVMVATDAVVVRNAEGKIDPNQSYITVLDQTATWETATNEAGDQYTREANVDAKWTFTKVLNGNYLPFTFKEWTGEDPIEETEVNFSHTGDSITMEQLFAAKVTSNYYIFDLYAQVFDSHGNEIYKLASRPIKKASVKEFQFYRDGAGVDSWGSLDNLDSKEEYTLKVYVQLGTGERPTLWEGKLAQ